MALLLLAMGVAFSIGGQIPFLSPGAAAASGGGDSGGSGLSGVFNKFLDPGLSWARVDDFIYTYTSADYWPSWFWAVCRLAGLCWRHFQGRLTRRDVGVLLLGLIFVLTIAELGLALTSTWRKTRYLFILCHPAFLLLAADGLARVFEALARFLPSRPVTTDRRSRTSP